MTEVMNLLPDPLHPALVHFPIVLVLVGSAVAIAALVWPRGQLPRWAAVLLVLGAVGAGAAYWTGEQGKELVGMLSPAAEELLDQHEDRAEVTLVASIAAAVLSLAGVVLARWPGVTKTMRIATVLAALTAVVCIVQTGHRGGMLVYKHAVGVDEATATVSTETGNEVESD
jgi:uncharacterized membrane protein